MEKQKITFNIKSYTYLYKWKIKKPKAVLHLIHGSIEHIGRYLPLIKYLNKHNISVYGIDQMGHGLSSQEQGNFGYIESYKLVIPILTEVNKIIKQENPKLKIVLYGHSMGSFILRYFMTDYKNYDVILSGTNYQGWFLTKLGLTILTWTSFFKGNHKINELVNNMSYQKFTKKMAHGQSWLSNDPAVQKKYDQDPLNDFKLTNQGFLQMFKWLDEIRKPSAFKNYQGRVLIASGGNDPVGNKGKGPKKTYQKFKSQGTKGELYILPKGHHEIHNDFEKLEVYNKYIEFILGNDL